MFNAACVCAFLIKANKIVRAGPRVIIAAVVHLLLLSRLVVDSKTLCSCLGKMMGSRKEGGPYAD